MDVDIGAATFWTSIIILIILSGYLPDCIARILEAFKRYDNSDN